MYGEGARLPKVGGRALAGSASSPFGRFYPISLWEACALSLWERAGVRARVLAGSLKFRHPCEGRGPAPFALAAMLVSAI